MLKNRAALSTSRLQSATRIDLTAPDFFLVGAPKCGTTAMDNYLGEHPDVLMCSRKEVHVFGRDIAPLDSYASYDTEGYLALFDRWQNRTPRRVGESSGWYLFSQSAADEIHAFAPGADILIMLRNPVDMLHSLHSHFLYSGREYVEDFETALALDPARASGRSPRRFVPLTYRAAVKFAPQVERYIRRFGREHVHVVVFEEFVSDPAGTYRRLCRFLGVDESFTPDFSVVNPNKRIRSKRLHRLSQRPPRPLLGFLRMVSTRRMRTGMFDVFQGLNSKAVKRPPMREEHRRALEAEFAPGIADLSELLDRDFTVWTGHDTGGGVARR